MEKNKTLSTGVLTKEPGTVCAVANILNLSQSNQRITIEVWNWTSYDNPALLPVYIGPDPAQQVIQPLEIASNHLAVVYADLQEENADLYEIRVVYQYGENIVVNCFGRSASPYQSQEGNTVIHNSLFEMSFDSDSGKWYHWPGM